MHIRSFIPRLAALLVVLTLTAFSGPRAGFAHCDSMNGPVVLDATRALASGELAPVYKWVTAADEEAVAAAFAEARAVRMESADARRLADRYFLETVVRLHRASEGMPYTGLKPASTPINPAVVAADEALASGDPEALVAGLTARVHDALLDRFAEAYASKAEVAESTEAGRQYVADYVLLTHLAEFLQEATESHASTDAHHAETTTAPHGH